MGRKASAFRGTTQLYCTRQYTQSGTGRSGPIPSSSNAEIRIGLPLLLQPMSSGANFGMVCAGVLSVRAAPPWARKRRSHTYSSPSSLNFIEKFYHQNRVVSIWEFEHSAYILQHILRRNEKISGITPIKGSKNLPRGEVREVGFSG